MLIVDRVLCDGCGCAIGQLFGLPAAQPDLLPDLRTAPEFTFCPDCSRQPAAIGHGSAEQQEAP
nr:hypothetical protein [uncultured Pseudomonas sp.]